MPSLFDSVRYLKGVGEARAKQLQNLGIETLYDLIAYFPRAYEDRSRMVRIAELEVDTPACFEAMVVSHPRLSHIRKGLDLVKVRVADETATLNLVFFNQSYMSDNLVYGQSYIFYGAISGDYLGYQMTNPVVEKPDEPGVATRRIMPVYSLTAGISNKLISRSVTQALEACRGSIPEVLPASERARYGLCGAQEAYDAIHNPPDYETLEIARRRLIFEEFFIFSIGLAILRRRNTEVVRTPMHDLSLKEFYEALPFELTGAQKRAVDEIRADVARPAPMARLIQGDVGSGKTMVAAAAVYLAARNGLQSAMMAPTEILAEQHYASLSAMFEPLGIRVVLLTGSMKAARRREAMEALALGQAQLAVGTHALLTDTTRFQSLGLVIVDEQHRFGVAQRAQLAQKGVHPNLLVMSATPIPRTLALIVYGDLDVSIIDELPPGRQSVDTYLVTEAMRERINAFIRKQVHAGHQCYIICPAVEESQLESLKSAQVWAQTLQKTVFPDLRIALLHGKMSGAEKEKVMGAFARGESDVLVATTVVEVGMDVPNATLIVIENADRFGLSQLHQLRGRVGRGQDKSYCVLFSSNRSPETQARLKALCGTNDGFKIAEEDLAMRGPGDLFGSRQHGLPAFKVGNLAVDLPTLKTAQQAAEEFLANPDYALAPEYQPLLGRVRALFAAESDIFN